LTQPVLTVTRWQFSGAPKVKPSEQKYHKPKKGPVALSLILKYPDASYKRNYSHSNPNGIIRDHLKKKRLWIHKTKLYQVTDSPNTVISGNLTSFSTIQKKRTKLTTTHTLNGLPVWQPPALSYSQACSFTPTHKKSYTTIPPIDTPRQTIEPPKITPIQDTPGESVYLLSRIKNLIQNTFNIQANISQLISKIQLISFSYPSRKEINDAIIDKLHYLLPPLQQGIPVPNHQC
jgi:hypothetical protein